MIQFASTCLLGSDQLSQRADELFREQKQKIILHTDRLFSWLMVSQWIFALGLAFWLSPRAWSGVDSTTHPHVWLAIFLGGLITSVPVALARTHPGEAITRHAIAVGQMLMSALLIHLTGGRIETHFHVFGSLAILAFYRDWRVLVSATLVVCADHLLRGFFWPESVYGVLYAPIWRSLEHAGWVMFEVAFLVVSIRKSLAEMLLTAERQAKLEMVNETVENIVADRTTDLTREIDERQQTENQLRQSQSQLAQAQQIAHLGNWEWDLLENKASWSEEARRLYGRRPDESGAAMEKYLEHVHPDDRPLLNKVLAESRRTGRPFVCDHRVKLPDGTVRSIHSRGEVFANERGEPVKMFGTVQDITEAKTAEESLRRSEAQLRQSQKMEAIGRLSGGVAHDFNNLLTVINGYGSLTMLQVAETDPIRKNIKEILNAAERATALTGQLLAFSRKQVVQPRVLNLNEVVRGMEKMLRRLIGEDVELSTNFEAGLRQVNADPGQIEQVIMNLAVNARDAMPLGGKLTIRTGNAAVDQSSTFHNRTLEAGDYVMLAVSDDGVGMSEEVQSHLFEPFFTTKGLGKGTGLGLATCYGIICHAGGDIRVYSELNSGTTFKIYLPSTDAVPETPASAHSEQMPAGRETVLVVEDDPGVRDLAVTVLRKCGYQVQTSHDAFEALEAIKRNPQFDLVITDVIMPRMSGKDLRDQIKAHHPRTEVLLMSGYTDDALAHHGVLDDGLFFLEKPFSPAKLARKVRQVLDA
jgi:PAS domain S-box-containing protein